MLAVKGNLERTKNAENHCDETFLMESSYLEELVDEDC